MGAIDFIKDCEEVGSEPLVTDEVVRRLLQLWTRFHVGYQKGRKGADRCLEALLLCTGKVVFNPKYSTGVQKGSKTELKEGITKCQFHDPSGQEIFEGIGRFVDASPWQSKEFNELKDNFRDNPVFSVSDAVLDKIWNCEGWAMLEGRLEQLSKIPKQRKTFAAVLHILVTKGLKAYQDESEEKSGPFMFSRERFIEYLQLYAILAIASKKSNETDVIEIIKSWTTTIILSVVDGLLEKSKNREGINFLSKCPEWNDSLRVADIAESIVRAGTRKLITSNSDPEVGDSSLEILFLKWFKVWGRTEREENKVSEFFDSIVLSGENMKSRLARYQLAQAISQVKTERARLAYIRVMSCALSNDVNAINLLRARWENEPENASEEILSISKSVSVELIKVTKFFSDFPKQAKRCLVAAFSTNPCQSLYLCLFPENQAEEASLVDNIALTGCDAFIIEELRQINFNYDESKPEDVQLPEADLLDLNNSIDEFTFKGLFRCEPREELRRRCEDLRNLGNLEKIENKRLENLTVDYEKYKDNLPDYDDDYEEKAYKPEKLKRILDLQERKDKGLYKPRKKPQKMVAQKRPNGIVKPRPIPVAKPKRNAPQETKEELTNTINKRLPWFFSGAVQFSTAFSSFVQPSELFKKEESVKSRPRRKCGLKFVKKQMSLVSSELEDYVNGMGMEPSRNQPQIQSMPQNNQNGLALTSTCPETNDGMDNFLDDLVRPPPTMIDLPEVVSRLWPTSGSGDGYPKNALTVDAFSHVVQDVFGKALVVGGKYSLKRPASVESEEPPRKKERVKKESSGSSSRRKASPAESQKRGKGRAKKDSKKLKTEEEKPDPDLLEALVVEENGVKSEVKAEVGDDEGVKLEEGNSEVTAQVLEAAGPFQIMRKYVTDVEPVAASAPKPQPYQKTKQKIKIKKPPPFYVEPRKPENVGAEVSRVTEQKIYSHKSDCDTSNTLITSGEPVISSVPGTSVIKKVYPSNSNKRRIIVAAPVRDWESNLMRVEGAFENYPQPSIPDLVNNCDTSGLASATETHKNDLPSQAQPLRSPEDVSFSKTSRRERSDSDISGICVVDEASSDTCDSKTTSECIKAQEEKPEASSAGAEEKTDGNLMEKCSSAPSPASDSTSNSSKSGKGNGLYHMENLMRWRNILKRDIPKAASSDNTAIDKPEKLTIIPPASKDIEIEVEKVPQTSKEETASEEEIVEGLITDHTYSKNPRVEEVDCCEEGEEDGEQVVESLSPEVDELVGGERETRDDFVSKESLRSPQAANSIQEESFIQSMEDCGAGTMDDANDPEAILGDLDEPKNEEKRLSEVVEVDSEMPEANNGMEEREGTGQEEEARDPSNVNEEEEEAGNEDEMERQDGITEIATGAEPEPGLNDIEKQDMEKDGNNYEEIESGVEESILPDDGEKELNGGNEKLEENEIEIVDLESDNEGNGSDEEEELNMEGDCDKGEDKDCDGRSTSSKSSRNKTPRPLTPVNMVEELIAKTDMMLNPTPKHKYAEKEQIKLARSVVEHFEKYGGRLRRLATAHVLVDRFVTGEKQIVKRSSRIRGKSKVLLQKEFKKIDARQSSTSSVDDSEEDDKVEQEQKPREKSRSRSRNSSGNKSKSTSRASSPELEILEEIVRKPFKAKPGPLKSLNSSVAKEEHKVRDVVIKISRVDALNGIHSKIPMNGLVNGNEKGAKTKKNGELRTARKKVSRRLSDDDPDYNPKLENYDESGGEEDRPDLEASEVPPVNPDISSKRLEEDDDDIVILEDEDKDPLAPDDLPLREVWQPSPNQTEVDAVIESRKMLFMDGEEVTVEKVGEVDKFLCVEGACPTPNLFPDISEMENAEFEDGMAPNENDLEQDEVDQDGGEIMPDDGHRSDLEDEICGDDVNLEEIIVPDTTVEGICDVDGSEMGGDNEKGTDEDGGEVGVMSESVLPQLLLEAIPRSDETRVDDEVVEDLNFDYFNLKETEKDSLNFLESVATCSDQREVHPAPKDLNVVEEDTIFGRKDGGLFRRRSSVESLEVLEVLGAEGLEVDDGNGLSELNLDQVESERDEKGEENVDECREDYDEQNGTSEIMVEPTDYAGDEDEEEILGGNRENNPGSTESGINHSAETLVVTPQSVGVTQSGNEEEECQGKQGTFGKWRQALSPGTCSEKSEAEDNDDYQIEPEEKAQNTTATASNQDAELIEISDDEATTPPDMETLSFAKASSGSPKVYRSPSKDPCQAVNEFDGLIELELNNLDYKPEDEGNGDCEPVDLCENPLGCLREPESPVGSREVRKISYAPSETGSPGIPVLTREDGEEKQNLSDAEMPTLERVT